MAILLQNQEANASVQQPTIVAQRVPGNGDIYPIGQFWIDVPNNDLYTLTSFSNGLPNWEATAGGAGSFASLVVDPGPSTLNGVTTLNGDINQAEVIKISEDGGALGTITIESLQGTSSDSILLHSVAGGIEVTTDGAADDIAITSTLGRVTIGSGENIADAIQIGVSGGVLSTLKLENTAGTGVSSVDISSAVGGIEISTAAAAGNIAITSDGGGTVVLGSTGNTGTNDLLLNLNGGALSELLINNELGTSVEAIKMLAPVGGIKIQAPSALAAIVLDADLGSIVIAPTDTTVSVDIANVTPAVPRVVTVSGSDVDSAVADVLNLGTGGVNTDIGASKVVNIATGDNLLGDTIVNIATGTAFTGTHDINIGTGTGGGTKRIDMGDVDALTAITAYGTINLNTSTSTGATAIGNALAGAVTVDTAAGISLDAATVSNFTVTGAADLTLRSTGGAVVVSSAEAAADAIQITTSDVAGGVVVSVNTTQLAVTTGNLQVSTATYGLVLPGGQKVVSGTGSPDTAVTAAKGSLFLRSDGSGVNDRMYVNTDGTTAWTAVVTVA